MYMPLCRICHARETRLNQDNEFQGNPELVDLQAENEAANERKDDVTPSLKKISPEKSVCSSTDEESNDLISTVWSSRN